MRDLESSLQQFGEFLLKAQVVRRVAPGVKAKRGERLPVVLSMPETVAGP